MTGAVMFLAAKVEMLSAVAPTTAKFTPCVKVPSLYKYASRNGSCKLWAVISYLQYGEERFNSCYSRMKERY